jgi:hypothetical protein
MLFPQELTYDGLSCPREFKKQYLKMAAAFGFNDAAKLANVGLYLDGRALVVYEELMRARTDHTVPTTIGAVLDALIDEFTAPTDNLINEFHNRRLIQGESIAKFATAIQATLTKAMPGLNESQRSPFLKNRLRSVLPDHLKVLVDFNDQLSWNELVKKLDRSSLSSSSSSRSSGGATAASTSKQTYINSFEPLIKEELEVNYAGTSQIKNRAPRRSSTAFSGECNFCGRPGHMERDCYKKKRDSNYHKYGDRNGNGSNNSSDRGGNSRRDQDGPHVNQMTVNRTPPMQTINELYEAEMNKQFTSQFSDFYNQH